MVTRVRGRILVGVGALLLLAFAQRAKPAAGPAPDNCDRQCLNQFVDQYLDAVVAHDPSKLAVTKNVKFTEDGQRLELGDGFWRTASARGSYTFYMDDPAAGEVGFFGTMREMDAPVNLALRLKIEGQQIAEIETIVVRDGINASRPTDTGAESFEKLGGPDPLFLEPLPPAERTSREDLARAANKYFSGMQLNDGKGDYSFFRRRLQPRRKWIHGHGRKKHRVRQPGPGQFLHRVSGLPGAIRIRTDSLRHAHTRPQIRGARYRARNRAGIHLLRPCVGKHAHFPDTGR